MLAGRLPGNDFGDHRVEVGRDFAAGFDPGVDAQGLAIGLGEVHGGEQTGAWLKIAAGIFGIQACLNRMAAGFQAFAQFAQWEQITGCQFDHPTHQIDAPHLFGDAVLNLQAGVYL